MLMRILITQQCNGIDGGMTYSSIGHRIDQGSSSIYSSSLFAHINASGQSVANIKPSDDQLLIGYHADGLPFMIVVDGFYGTDRQLVFSFINDHVLRLIPDYVTQLTIKDDARIVSQLLIKDIYKLRAEHAVHAEFTLSIAAVYQQQRGLFCAGFGIGDTGIVIKRSNGSIEQLVAHTEVDGFKDAFDSYCSSQIDSVLARNEVFVTQVAAGDELVGYTYLPPELEYQQDRNNTFDVKANTSKTRVNYLCLNAGFVEQSMPLFNQLSSHCNLLHQSLIEKAQQAKKDAKFGDDFTLGAVSVPSMTVQCNVLIHTLSTALSSFIAKQQEPSGLFSFFRTNWKARASQYEQIILDNLKDSLFVLTVFKDVLLSSHDKLLQEYLVADIGYPSLEHLKETIDYFLGYELKPATDTSVHQP